MTTDGLAIERYPGAEDEHAVVYIVVKRFLPWMHDFNSRWARADNPNEMAVVDVDYAKAMHLGEPDQAGVEVVL